VTPETRSALGWTELIPNLFSPLSLDLAKSPRSSESATTIPLKATGFQLQQQQSLSLQLMISHLHSQEMAPTQSKEGCSPPPTLLHPPNPAANTLGSADWQEGFPEAFKPLFVQLLRIPGFLTSPRAAKMERLSRDEVF